MTDFLTDLTPDQQSKALAKLQVSFLRDGRARLGRYIILH
jgi:hypothetical protein